jgi:uncharacterized membrane protein YqjE
MPVTDVPGARSVQALGRLGHALLGVLHTRGRLLVTELEVERAAQEARVLHLVIAAGAAGMCLLLVTFLAIVALWDTHRLEAIGGTALLYAVIAGWAAWRAGRIAADKPPLLGATLDELDRDRRALNDGALARRVAEAAGMDGR